MAFTPFGSRYLASQSRFELGQLMVHFKTPRCKKYHSNNSWCFSECQLHSFYKHVFTFFSWFFHIQSQCFCKAPPPLSCHAGLVSHTLFTIERHRRRCKDQSELSPSPQTSPQSPNLPVSAAPDWIFLRSLPGRAPTSPENTPPFLCTLAPLMHGEDSPPQRHGTGSALDFTFSQQWEFTDKQRKVHLVSKDETEHAFLTGILKTDSSMETRNLCLHEMK